MGPFDASSWVLDIAIGFAFGFILESVGFGDSRKLAAQFYLRDLAVLKVMFTGIIVAAALIFGATSLGLLDFGGIWVNPTFLWSAIAGGLIFGAGFAIGGYCPGTALASAATLKIDGMFYVGGVAIGVWLFGETAGPLTDFMDAGSMGRFTLPELFGLPIGVVLVLVVGMALFMFWGGDRLVKALRTGPAFVNTRAALFGAGALVAVAVIVALNGQPTPDQKWQRLASKYGPKLERREVHLDPGELLELMNDAEIRLRVVDVRPESDWNQFHLADAVHVLPEDVIAFRPKLASLPESAIIVLASNDEAAAELAWKRLSAMGIANAYILEGGMNRWLDIYGESPGAKSEVAKDDTFRHEMAIAWGGRHPASEPDAHHAPRREFVHKAKLQKTAKKGGGCG